MENKKIKSFIKDLRDSRIECMNRVPNFKSEVNTLISKRDNLLKQINAVQHEIDEKKCLIKTYGIIDERDLFHIWRLEKLHGITKSDWIEYKNKPENLISF